MKQEVGLDVSQQETAVCIVDQTGTVIFQGEIGPGYPGGCAAQTRASCEWIGFETGAMALAVAWAQAD
jgi:hypothetical protein